LLQRGPSDRRAWPFRWEVSRWFLKAPVMPARFAPRPCRSHPFIWWAW
jgi:hypothetical protein